MDQLQEIIDGRLTGVAAATGMRAAVLELYELHEKSRVLGVRIKRAETALIYGVGEKRPLDPYLLAGCMAGGGGAARALAGAGLIAGQYGGSRLSEASQNSFMAPVETTGFSTGIQDSAGQPIGMGASLSDTYHRAAIAKYADDLERIKRNT